MGAMVQWGSSRYAATVVGVAVFKSGPRKGQPRQVDVQLDGLEPSPTRSFLWNARGYWREKGWGRYGPLLLLGKREQCINHTSPPLLITGEAR